MDSAGLITELDRLHHRATDMRARERQLADAGENDPASDAWKTAAILAASAESEVKIALVEAWPALAALLREAGDGWRPIPVTEEIVGYVARYGGRCRDCADTTYGPICDGAGLPCGERKGIEHVLKAINYGFEHGFLKLPAPPAAGGKYGE